MIEQEVYWCVQGREIAPGAGVWAIVANQDSGRLLVGMDIGKLESMVARLPATFEYRVRPCRIAVRTMEEVVEVGRDEA